MSDQIGPLFPSLACALMALTLAVTPPARVRSWLAAAIVAFALGAASIEVAGGGVIDAARLSSGFLAIADGLLLPAPVLLGVMLYQNRRLGVLSAGILLAPLVAGLVVVVPLLEPAGWWPPVAAAAAMIGVALSLGWAGRRFGIESRVGRVDDRPSGHFGPPAEARWLRDQPLLVAEAICLTGALLAPQVDLLFTAVAGGVAFGYLAGRRAGAARGLPVGLLVSLVALGGAWWLTVTVPGAVPGRTLAALRGAPFSPELEMLVALLLLSSAWPLLRLWPFHGGTAGVLSPLFGLALLVRVAVAVAPLGVAHWLPAAAAVAAIASWHGAARMWTGEVLIAAGVCAVLSLPESRAWAGPGLIALGTLRSLADPAARASLAKVLNLILTAGVAALLPMVLANALAEETVWATVLAAGLAVAWSREWSPRSRVDLSTPPGHIPNSSPGISLAP